jgi:hypothetical protein
MKGFFIFAIVIGLAWYIDHSRFGGQYFAALSQMASQVLHHAR